ncbi:MAG: hypothetical protein GY830_00740 [Bacteroidetes bacterium]|nr:hypothetical protein [Bacteroidota bacterium]
MIIKLPYTATIFKIKKTLKQLITFIIVLIIVLKDYKAKAEKLKININWDIGTKLKIYPPSFGKCDYQIKYKKLEFYETIKPGSSIYYGFYIAYPICQIKSIDTKLEWEGGSYINYYHQKDLCELYSFIIQPLSFVINPKITNFKFKFHFEIGYIFDGKIFKKKIDITNNKKALILDMSKRPRINNVINPSIRAKTKNILYGVSFEIFYEIKETYNFSFIITYLTQNIDNIKNYKEDLSPLQFGFTLGYNFKKLIEQSIKKNRTKRLFTIEKI